MNTRTIWVSCGVLRSELTELHRRGDIDGELCFLDSMLHMVPQELQATLETAIERPRAEGNRLILVYGDCCGRMLDLVRQFQVGRVAAINCAQMLVGRARYRELMHEQAFILLPEWATRWKEAMQTELGLSPQVARELMRDSRSALVYLDTGLSPIPHQALADCAAYSGLTCRIESVGLNHLLGLLLDADAGVPVRPLGSEVP